MFSRMTFSFDRSGKLRDAPLELRAADVRGSRFYLNTATYRSRGHGECPALHVCRAAADVATDPYNEDGRPPDVCTIIVYPNVTFVGNCVEVIGFEHPVMAWAGHPRPAYQCCPPLDVAADLLWPGVEGRAHYEAVEPPHEVAELPRQLVRLFVGAAPPTAAPPQFWELPLSRRAFKGVVRAIAKRRGYPGFVSSRDPRLEDVTVNEVCELTAEDLRESKNFGAASLTEVADVLGKIGMRLRGWRG